MGVAIRDPKFGGASGEGCSEPRLDGRLLVHMRGDGAAAVVAGEVVRVLANGLVADLGCGMREPAGVAKGFGAAVRDGERGLA